MSDARPLAIVTGASSGIGYELARVAAERRLRPRDRRRPAAGRGSREALRSLGARVETVETDLASEEGNDRLLGLSNGRPVAALLANAGQGLGDAFLDQDFQRVRQVIDTNITGTLYLVQQVGREMRRRSEGRILITGSIAGFMPGAFQAVYNGTKAFIDSFAFAIREEMKDTGVTVTVLMPGATETEFFERADLEDTKIGEADKDDPADVAAHRASTPCCAATPTWWRA